MVSWFTQKLAGLLPDSTLLGLVRRLSSLHKQVFFLSLDLVVIPAALLIAIAIKLGEVQKGLFGTDIALFILSLQFLGVAFSYALKLPGEKLNSFETGGLGRVAFLAVALSITAFALERWINLGFDFGLYVIFGLVFFLGATLTRLSLLHLVMHLYRKDETRCRVIIYGAGNTGLQLAQALKAHQSIVPVAFADDNPVLQGRMISGLPVLKPGDLFQFAHSRGINRLLLAMPSLSPPKRTQIARRFQDMGLEVQALPSFAQLIGQDLVADNLAPVLPQQVLGRAHLDPSADTQTKHLSGRTILITGAGGSIGSELCRQIVAQKPTKIVLFELSELALFTIENELRTLTNETEIALVPVLGSVTDARLVTSVLMGHSVDVVIHAAAYKHVPLVEANVLVGLSNNVLGTATLARAALDAKVERFILVSSDKAVRPTNVMGASKRLAELVVQDLAERGGSTIFAMVRFGNVLGSSGSVIPLFQEQIARGGPVTLTHPRVTRYFMTVHEAVRLVLRAASFAKGGEVFVLDMGKPLQVGQIARKMIKMAGYTVRDDLNPDGDISIQITGLRPGEKLAEELLIGEGHLTTPDEKIFAAREANLSEIEVASMLRSLRAAADAGDEAAALSVVSRWVEGWADRALLQATED